MLNFRLDNLRGDLYGGLTAGVVALPLALAFGEASGAGPIAGLYGAIFVGFFAALFGGTESQISGPTGPMIVVFAGVYATLVVFKDFFDVVFYLWRIVPMWQKRLEPCLCHHGLNLLDEPPFAFVKKWASYVCARFCHVFTLS